MRSNPKHRRSVYAELRRLRRSGDRGIIIILTALLLLPLMAATGFAVDIGAWYARAEQMQRAADAAALAGVVWADRADTTYRTVAWETAAKNGFVHDPPRMTVDVQRVNNNQVRVTITDDATQYFSTLFLRDPRLTRKATAEYIEPIPMGSPRNFLGTGRLGYNGTSTSSYYPEGLALSINGYCTSKNQGDRKAAERVSSENCSGTLNADYSSENYEFYVELPAGRTYATDVLIYDGGYMPDTCNNDGSGVSPDQCRNDTDQTLETRELAPSLWFPPDFNPGGGSQGDMETRFRLYRADNTPLDDSDNPAMDSLASNCVNATRSWANAYNSSGSTINPRPDGSQTFAPNTKLGMTNTGFFPSGSGADFRNISVGWYNLCRIPSSAPAGKYILRVDHLEQDRNGSNNFGVVAHRVGTTSTSLCNSVGDATCPKVYAKQYLSVRAAAASSSGEFYLSEVPAVHAGKTLRIELWDPAEGGESIEILRPTAANTWTPVNFNWSDDAGNSQNNVPEVPVSSYNFNGNLLTLEYQLPTTYSNPGGNAWWKIRYNFSSGTVTDRTTWGVSISGDPVHLVE